MKIVYNGCVYRVENLTDEQKKIPGIAKAIEKELLKQESLKALEVKEIKPEKLEKHVKNNKVED